MTRYAAIVLGAQTRCSKTMVTGLTVLDRLSL